MGHPLVGVLLLLLVTSATPAASKPLLSEARRAAHSLGGWSWLQEDADAPSNRGPGAGGGGLFGPQPEDNLRGADDLDESTEQRSWEVVPAGPASKRALSVLSRFTPFTSLGTRLMGRYPVRARGPTMPRDYISAETRGDFSDRPSGQPLRWGR